MADQERWVKEQEFFDAEEYSEDPIPANTIERYTACTKPFLSAEYPFWVLGDVRGKRILDLGCGDGIDSLLLAFKGAQVVGIDISPRAIEVAKKRARMHGIEDRVEFYALPLESYLKQAKGRFDIICGFAVLHHLLPVLDSVMTDLEKLSHQETAFMFHEPVALSSLVRRLRLLLFRKPHGTPDERPLEPQDLAILRRHLPDLKLRFFGFLLRVWWRISPGRYEEYSPARKMIFDLLARFDAALLSLPGFHGIAATAVMYAPGAGQTGRLSRKES
jgi:SAM-dependent methyltransferase